MAAFNPNEVNNDQLDWTILRDGGTALYWRPEFLAHDMAWFEANGYILVPFDASEWNAEVDMHTSLKAKLSFPEYCGMNLDALNECLWDDLGVPDSSGLVLIFHKYD